MFAILPHQSCELVQPEHVPLRRSTPLHIEAGNAYHHRTRGETPGWARVSSEPTGGGSCARPTTNCLPGASADIQPRTLEFHLDVRPCGFPYTRLGEHFLTALLGWDREEMGHLGRIMDNKRANASSALLICVSSPDKIGGAITHTHKHIHTSATASKFGTERPWQRSKKMSEFPWGVK